LINEKEENKKHADYIFGKVDFFKNPKLAERMQVCDLPNIKIFNEGTVQATINLAK